MPPWPGGAWGGSGAVGAEPAGGSGRIGPLCVCAKAAHGKSNAVAHAATDNGAILMRDRSDRTDMIALKRQTREFSRRVSAGIEINAVGKYLRLLDRGTAQQPRR